MIWLCFSYGRFCAFIDFEVRFSWKLQNWHKGFLSFSIWNIKTQHLLASFTQNVWSDRSLERCTVHKTTTDASQNLPASQSLVTSKSVRRWSATASRVKSISNSLIKCAWLEKLATKTQTLQSSFIKHQAPLATLQLHEQYWNYWIVSYCRWW